MESTPPAAPLAARYRLLERIAVGGMASVWRAKDEVLAREVAVKVLHEDLARDEGFLERFRQEAVAAARLSHPRIVRVYDTGTDGDVCFIVMEFFEGRDLGSILAAGPVEPSRAAWIVSCALEGLGHAHENGVIHRDVKPGNILVRDDGSVKVTDFGVAKAALAGNDLTTTGKVLGTVRYLSPEQVRGEPVDARSDVYSAGLVLYEALTGRPAFEAETHMATATMRLTQDPLPPRAVRAGISRELERVTLRALARDPDARYASAEDMRLALGRALGEITGEIRPVSVPARERPAAQAARPREASFFRSWMLVPLVLLVITALLVVGGLLIGRLELGGPLGVQIPEEGGAAVEIVSVRDHDPDGDGAEDREDVPNAADGNPDTTWRTERYDSAQLGGLKPGVGLVVELPPGAEVSAVTVRSPFDGWTFEIHAGTADANLEDTAALPDAEGATSFTVRDGTARAAFRAFDARFVLIWITQLAPSEGGFRAEISEIEVERG